MSQLATFQTKGIITVWDSANYRLVSDTNQQTWANADNYCQSTYGQNLASVHSTAQTNEIVSLLVSAGVTTETTWIGLSESPADSENWSWLDGTTFDYTNFAVLEPDNSGDEAVAIELDGEWRDLDEGDTLTYFVCNYVDTTPPIVVITSPQNISYGSTDVQVEYTVDDGTVEVFINGAVNSTNFESGSMLSGLIPGSYNLTIASTDAEGNVGKDEVFFEVDLTAPVVLITSPMNSTYSELEIQLDYSVSDGITTVYLDGIANTTDLPNGSMTQLFPGSYNYTVTAVDEAGNIGFSTVLFTITLNQSVTETVTITESDTITQSQTETETQIDTITEVETNLVTNVITTTEESTATSIVSAIQTTTVELTNTKTVTFTESNQPDTTSVSSEDDFPVPIFVLMMTVFILVISRVNKFDRSN